MGTVIELFVVMLVMAGLVFAPLGYFIYSYTRKSGDPFGNTEPHGDSESALLVVVDTLISKVKSLIKA